MGQKETCWHLHEKEEKEVDFCDNLSGALFLGAFLPAVLVIAFADNFATTVIVTVAMIFLFFTANRKSSK